jgi:hypothetical protein
LEESHREVEGRRQDCFDVVRFGFSKARSAGAFRAFFIGKKFASRNPDVSMHIRNVFAEGE